MKIVNIDAHIELVEKVQSLMIPRFILDVIKPLEEKYYTVLAGIQMIHPSKCYVSSKVSLPTFPIRMFWEKTIGYENIATLIHTIPIYLRGVKPNERKSDYDIIETLGAYYPIAPNNPNIKRDSPYIELFLTPISDAANGNDTHFKWLFTKVLLHELAHAAMDIHNIEEFEGIEEKKFIRGFREWREESMANAVALRIIKDYENDVRYCCQKGFYDYAKDFILNNEPDMYKLGVPLEDFDYWDFKSVISGKINGVHSDLQKEWLTYVNGNPTAEGLKEWNDALSSKYAYIFNNKIYTRSNVDELITDIVTPVLDNYKNANNSEMNEETFISTFKYLNIEKCSEATDDFEDNSRNSRIRLNEGVFSLYQNHSNNLSTLFKDAGVKDKYIEYINF